MPSISHYKFHPLHPLHTRPVSEEPVSYFRNRSLWTASFHFTLQPVQTNRFPNQHALPSITHIDRLIWAALPRPHTGSGFPMKPASLWVSRTESGCFRRRLIMWSGLSQMNRFMLREISREIWKLVYRTCIQPAVSLCDSVLVVVASLFQLSFLLFLLYFTLLPSI